MKTFLEKLDASKEMSFDEVYSLMETKIQSTEVKSILATDARPIKIMIKTRKK